MSGLRLVCVNRSDDLDVTLDRFETYFQTAHLQSAQVASRLRYTVRLTIEELLTNIIKYGYEDSAEHLIYLDFALGPPATLRIEDDGRPFDPTLSAPVPDLDAPIAERPIGGLGLHLIRAQTAAMRYARRDGINRLDLVFLE